MKSLIYPLLGLAIFSLLVSCNQSTPTKTVNTTIPTQNQIGSTVTLTREPTSKPSPTPITTSYQPTAIVTNVVPTPTASPIPTRLPTPTASPIPTRLPTPTASPIPTMLPTTTLEAGQPITLTILYMADESVGWATDSANHIVRTTDSGLTWIDVSPKNLNADYMACFFLNAQSAWAYDDSDPSNGLTHTIDGGKTWSIIAKSLPFVAYTRIAFLNDEDGWAETYDVGAGQANITLYETHDSGATWNQIMLTPPADTLNEFPGTLHLCNICGDSFYYDPARLIITYGDLASDPAGEVRLSVSKDLGKTWKDLHLAMPSNKFADGLVAPQLPVFFNDKDGFLPFGIVKYNPDGSHAYAVLAIYATHDGGLSWISNSTVVENVQNMIQDNHVVDFVSPTDAFVACENDLCVTHDGTQTWQKLTSSLNFAYVEGREYVGWFDFVNLTAGWAITSDGSQYTLWRTTDGGMTWRELTPQLNDGH